MPDPDLATPEREPSLALPDPDGRPTRIITGANKSGGSVKTTTLTALAVLCAQAGLRVGYIDGDDQRDSSHIFGLDDPDADENVVTLWDIVEGSFDILEAFTSARVGEGGPVIPNLWFVPASRKLKSLDLHLASRTGREMWLHKHAAKLRGLFDIVFFDCPGQWNLFTQAAILECDEVAACVKSQDKESRALVELEADIDHLRGVFGRAGELAWVVIGEGVIKENGGKVYVESAERVREAYGDIVVPNVIRRTKVVPEAYSAQVALPLFDPRADVVEDYRKAAVYMELIPDKDL